jgi:hypothetical protein
MFIHNIVYDTFQGTNHSVFKSETTNVSVSFSSNVYYHPLLFRIQKISFSEWQKTGQDNGSVVADLLFIGDVNQYDFFTIQSNSSAAQLGFANITKLSKCGLLNVAVMI